MIRRTFIIAAVIAAGVLHAQPTPQQIVRSKTEAALHDIAGSVKGVLGFAALDLVKGERFGMNEQIQFPQASAIKIPILMEVHKQAHEGKISLSDLHWVEKKKQVAGSGILTLFGDRTAQLSVADLCVLMIVLSDNSATNMLIDLIGMENVNATLRSLGVMNTRLQRKMMDQEASARGDENLSTPADALRIMELLYRGEFVNRQVSDAVLAVLKKGKGGALQSAVPENVEVAFKPGGIAGVSTEWGIVYLPKLPYAVAMMVSFASGDEADQALRSVARMLYEHYARSATATRYGTYTSPWK